MFDRLMTLLNALWDNFDASFEDEIHFSNLIGVDKVDLLYVLERIGKKYLNKEEENVVGKSLFMNIDPCLTF
jgi:tRNA guanosine-2'-O-methyltransferase